MSRVDTEVFISPQIGKKKNIEDLSLIVNILKKFLEIFKSAS